MSGNPHAPGGLHKEIEDVAKEMEKLRVPELKAVARAIGLSLTGRKADLQDRIRAYLKNSCRVGHIDPWRPRAISALIGKVRLAEPLPNYESVWQSLKTGAYAHPVATGHVQVSTIANSSSANPRVSLNFRESPFYRLKRLVNGSPRMATKNTGRGVCSFKFTFTEQEEAILGSGPEFKLFLFSGVYNSLGSRGDVPIQFPHPNEIRFNDTLIKDNVRGLKNKVGTAKPANLTPYLRQRPMENNLQLVYAFTKEDYLIYCYIVEVIQPEEILQNVLRHPKIVKPATLQYLKETLNEEEDDELMTTSTVMTLQCPISYCRMKYPAKSIHCQHLQCFDAMWYIQSQQQIPTWQCPVCQKHVSIKDLAICEFVEEIIEQCGEDIEQIEFSSDGSWVAKDEDENQVCPSPKSHTPVIKNENAEEMDIEEAIDGEDLDGEDGLVGIRRSQRNATSAQPEQVIISLDSDEEPDEGVDVQLESKNHGEDHAEIHQQSFLQDPNNPRLPPVSQMINYTGTLLNRESDTLSNIYGTYMDNGNQQGRTLDPRNLSVTPSGAKNNVQHNETPSNVEGRGSATFTQRHHQVPNLLGKTPLSNNNIENDADALIGDQDSPSPESSRGHKQNHTNSNVGNGIDASSANDSNKSKDQPPKLTLGEVNVPLFNTSGGTSGLPASARNVYGQTNMQNAGNVADITKNNFLGINGNLDSIVNFGKTVQHEQENNSVTNTQPENRAEPCTENLVPTPPIERMRLPPMPPMPPLPANGASPIGAMNPPPLPSISSLSTTSGSMASPQPNTNLRNKKPTVSPFIPRKPYLNILPQKRHLSNGSAGSKDLTRNSLPSSGESTADKISLSSHAGSALPQKLNSINSRSTSGSDIIDLTSDD